MNPPLHLKCRTVGDIPSIGEIQQLITNTQGLVLELPQTSDPEAPAFDKRALIQELASGLPDYSVFESAGQKDSVCIAIIKVISEQDVLVNADRIVAAARQFRATANDLMARLSQKLSFSFEELSDEFFRLTRGQVFPERLDEEWEYWFHGLECQFTNTRTGQVLEIRLGFQGEFGVLDPWFFSEFVSTTSGLEDVAHLFKDGFHDLCRAIEVLARHGYLKRVVRTKFHASGFVAGEA